MSGSGRSSPLSALRTSAKVVPQHQLPVMLSKNDIDFRQASLSWTPRNSKNNMDFPPSSAVVDESKDPGHELPWFSASHILWFIKPSFDLDFLYFHIVASSLFVMFTAGIFCAFEGSGLAYIDALYSAVSCFCLTGNTTVNVSTWSTGSHIFLLITVIPGGIYISNIAFVFLRLAHVKRMIKMYKDDPGPVLDHYTFERDASYKLLGVIGWCYFLTVGAASIIMGCWLKPDDEKGVRHPWWWAVFHAMSSFNNCGISLSQDNLLHFSQDYVVLISIGTCITLGGAWAPIMVRWVLVLMKKLSSDGDVYDFILDKGHVYYNIIMNSTLTKITLVYSVAMSVVTGAVLLWQEWDSDVLAGLNSKEKLLSIWFTVISARFAGYNCINMGGLSLSSILILIGIMYLPSIPVVDSTMPAKFSASSSYAMFRNHSRRMISRWTVHIVVCIFVLTLVEENRPKYDLLNAVFEAVSAFGTVGYTMGVTKPGLAVPGTSFSEGLTTFGKLIIMYLMMLGRHRDLLAFTNQLRQVEYRGYDWPLKVGLPLSNEGEAVSESSRTSMQAGHEFVLSSARARTVSHSGSRIEPMLPALFSAAPDEIGLPSRNMSIVSSIAGSRKNSSSSDGGGVPGMHPNQDSIGSNPHQGFMAKRRTSRGAIFVMGARRNSVGSPNMQHLTDGSSVDGGSRSGSGTFVRGFGESTFAESPAYPFRGSPVLGPIRRDSLPIEPLPSVEESMSEVPSRRSRHQPIRILPHVPSESCMVTADPSTSNSVAPSHNDSPRNEASSPLAAPATLDAQTTDDSDRHNYDDSSYNGDDDEVNLPNAPIIVDPQVPVDPNPPQVLLM